MNGAISAVLVLVGAVGGGALAALVYAVANKGKTKAEEEKIDAEATDILAKTAVELLDKAVKQADATEQRLIKEVQSLEKKVDLLTAVVRSLLSQIREEGLEPTVPEGFEL